MEKMGSYFSSINGFLGSSNHLVTLGYIEIPSICPLDDHEIVEILLIEVNILFLRTYGHMVVCLSCNIKVHEVHIFEFFNPFIRHL